MRVLLAAILFGLSFGVASGGPTSVLAQSDATTDVATDVDLAEQCLGADAWWSASNARWQEAASLLAQLDAAAANGEAGPGDYAAVANRLAGLGREQIASSPPEAGEEVHEALLELFTVAQMATEAEALVAFASSQPAHLVQAGQAQLGLLGQRYATLGPRLSGLAAGFVEECGL